MRVCCCNSGGAVRGNGTREDGPSPTLHLNRRGAKKGTRLSQGQPLPRRAASIALFALMELLFAVFSTWFCFRRPSGPHIRAPSGLFRSGVEKSLFLFLNETFEDATRPFSVTRKQKTKTSGIKNAQVHHVHVSISQTKYFTRHN